MRKLTETTRVVVEKTIVEQVLEAPLNTVIKVRFGRLDYVLHRTGRDGWLVTRNLGMGFGGSDRFHNNDEIAKFIGLSDNSEVFILTD